MAHIRCTATNIQQDCITLFKQSQQCSYTYTYEIKSSDTLLTHSNLLSMAASHRDIMICFFGHEAKVSCLLVVFLVFTVDAFNGTVKKVWIKVLPVPFFLKEVLAFSSTGSFSSVFALHALPRSVQGPKALRQSWSFCGPKCVARLSHGDGSEELSPGDG